MGATFNWVFPQTFTPQTNWFIDGKAVPTDTDETATHDTLTLQFRVSQSILKNVLRPLKTDEGKVELLTTDDGGFVAIDRADGGNSFTLTPPDPREPLRQEGTYHVNRYEETLIEQTGDEWDVELDLMLDADREDSKILNQGINGAAFNWTFPQTFGRREWGFTNRYGSISTKRVDAEFAGTGKGGVERYEIVARLTFDQAHSFETALARVAGTRIKEIPDAPNKARDETDTDDMTITVDSPDQDTISDGDYVVLEWESERLNDAFQQVSFTLAG